MNNKNKRKILYVITKSNWGGAQRYVYDLVTGLPNNMEGVVAFGGSGVLNEKLTEAGVSTVIIPKLGRNIDIFGDIFVFFSLIKLFLHEKPNVVHLNSSKIGGLGAFAGRIYNLISYILKKIPIGNSNLPKLKIIFTVHGWAFNEPRGFLQITIIKLISWTTVFLSHNTIAVSQKDYKQGINMLFVGNKMRLVHNGIGDVVFEKKNIAREIILGKKSDKLPENIVLIGVIAELTKNKGIGYALKAMSELNEKNKNNVPKNKKLHEGNILNSIPPIALVIIGDGEDKFKLANIIKNTGLSKKVFLVGFKENASSLLNAFDIFLFPSVKEGLPYALLEAGSAKMPVIASHVGGIPEIIDDMKSGILVRSKAPMEIYKAIIFLIENKNKMEEFGNSLNLKIEKEFSLSKMIKKTLDVYRHQS